MQRKFMSLSEHAEEPILLHIQPLPSGQSSCAITPEIDWRINIRMTFKEKGVNTRIVGIRLRIIGESL